ncbi:MAG: 50S ribosomal protein L13 [bacterium]
MKTTWPKQSEIKRDWYLVDVSGVILGRAATNVASLLIGKGKIEKVSNYDCGDFVIVLNSDKIKVTGKKLQDKMYYRHTGFAKGLRQENLSDLLKRDSRKVFTFAVKNMLPNNKLRDTMITRLYIYKDGNHPHEAQKPTEIKLK